MTSPSVRLGFDRQAKIFLYTICAALGAGLGAGIPFLAGWAASLPWIPFQGPLRLAASFDSAPAAWGRPALGLVVGLGFAAHVVYESPVLRVSAQRIEVSIKGATRHIARSDVAGLYRDGRKIVVESHAGRRLFHGEVEGGKDAVRSAFVSHGYPWETI